MLKKAGIVVAAATAGLLALSPLAFAGDKADDHDDKNSSYSHDGHHNGGGDNGDGGNDNNSDSIVDSTIVDSNINNCENTQTTDDGDSEAGAILGAISLLDDNNVNALQCTNILNNFLNDNTVGVDVL